MQVANLTEQLRARSAARRVRNEGGQIVDREYLVMTRQRDQLERIVQADEAESQQLKENEVCYLWTALDAFIRQGTSLLACSKP